MELDIGCGKNKYPSAIGLDMNPAIEGIDIIYEIRGRQYLPFTDNSFSRIRMMDLIEHISNIHWFLSEVHRVSQPDAKVKMKYPHYSGRGAYSDATHVHALGIHAFDHFDPATEFGNTHQYYTLFGRNFPYTIDHLTLEFPRPTSKLSGLICGVMGTNNYEKYIANFLPISSVNLELRVIKNLFHIPEFLNSL